MFSGINDFFTYLTHFLKGDTEFIAKNNELKLIYKVFKTSKYKYITKDRAITALFLNKMYNLFQNIFICFELLDNTLFNRDNDKKKLYQKYYIESFFTEDDLTRKNKFDKDAMMKKITESDNPNKVIMNIENDFTEFKKRITTQNFPMIETEYNFLYAIYHITTFNFESFFSKFDPSFSIKNAKQPVFTSISGSEILNDIKDMYYITATLPKKMNVIQSITKLARREKGEYAESYAKRFQEAIDAIYKIIQAELNQDIFLNMARYIDQNPRLKMRLSDEKIPILENYRKEISDTFNKTKDLIAHQYSEKSLQKDIKELFQDKMLLQVEGFGDELVALIEKKNAGDINGIQGLRITKTFINEVYEKNYKELLNTFILEGFFVDKEFQKAFSDAYFRLNEIKKYFDESERSLATGTGNSFKSLVLLLSGNGTGNDKKIKMTSDVINERVVMIIQKSIETFYTFGKVLFIALNEYRTAKPEKITNIKELKGSNNKEFISSIANFYNLIAKYNKLMKNFVKIEK